MALTDSAGAVKNTYAYDPYGTVTSSTGSVANPYRFGGSYGAYTDSSGLLKIGQRYYDSSLGRWTQQDLVAGALSNPMTLNRYTYVACNPVNSIDPTGSSALLNCGIAAAIGGVILATGTVAGAVGAAWIVGGGITTGAIQTAFWGGLISGAVTGCLYAIVSS